MSSNLEWEPVKHNRRTLSTSMKFALRKLLGHPIHAEIGGSYLSILTAMSAAGDDDIVKDCNILIEAIEKYGSVILDEVY